MDTIKIPQIKASRIIHWTGGVDEDKLRLHSADLAKMVLSGGGTIGLLLSNTGGKCVHGYGFYDLVKCVLKPELVTMVSGSAESMGVILYLSATAGRIMTKNSSLFFHEIGAILKEGRYSLSELKNATKDNESHQKIYAEIIAENSQGKLTVRKVLKMMKRECRIYPDEAMRLGLCDLVLK